MDLLCRPLRTPPKAQAAFRYYRFSQASSSLFESYRYTFLCLESILDDLHPKSSKRHKSRLKALLAPLLNTLGLRFKGGGETGWLRDAMDKALSRYNLDLSSFAARHRSPIEGFIQGHYGAVRCATFHAKASEGGGLLPGDLRDSATVLEQLRKFQPLVEDLLKKHFGARLGISFLTPFAVDSALTARV
jgi:hypothetical protein